MRDGGHTDGITVVNGFVSTVSSTRRPPRMPSDGSCGCERFKRFGPFGEEYVLRLCGKHGREPGIREYCLEER